MIVRNCRFSVRVATGKVKPNCGRIFVLDVSFCIQRVNQCVWSNVTQVTILMPVVLVYLGLLENISAFFSQKHGTVLRNCLSYLFIVIIVY